jgi:hypothetical protein
LATASIFTQSGVSLNESTLTAGDTIALTADIKGDVRNKSLQLVLRYNSGQFLTVCSTGAGTIQKDQESSVQTIAAVTIPSAATAFINKDKRIRFYFQSVTDIKAVATLMSGEFGLTANPGSIGTITIPSPNTGLTYTKTFTQADLSSSGTLPITHNFGKYPTSIIFTDNTNDTIYPDDVESTSVNVVTVTLASAMPIVGTWKAELEA